MGDVLWFSAKSTKKKLCSCSAHARRVVSESNVADPMNTITDILPGSKLLLLLLRIVMRDGVRSVCFVFPELKIQEYLFRHAGDNEEAP